LSGTTTNTPTVTLQPFFSGVVLDVTPQIDGEGNVLLHVHPSVSSVSTITKGINLGSQGGSVSLPLAASSTSEMDSMVRGQNGRVIAIGGLMRQSASGDQSQVPGMGSVPVLGALFRNTGRTSQKRELVVLIKPTIVDGNTGIAVADELNDTSRRIDELNPRQQRELR
jgi:MSHA biogenesis protein MshL